MVAAAPRSTGPATAALWPDRGARRPAWHPDTPREWPPARTDAPGISTPSAGEHRPGTAGIAETGGGTGRPADAGQRRHPSRIGMTEYGNSYRTAGCETRGRL